MKKVIIAIFSILSIQSVYAQRGGDVTKTQSVASLSEKDKGKIVGAVLDKGSNQPVEFATVALMKSGEQTPIDGTVCDAKGQFTINRIPNGTYTVTISFIGYETHTIENVVISDAKSEVYLGIIKLSDGSSVLEEVVVEAEKLLVEERVDRTVYNAENDETTRGGDASDVLKRVPMLSVDLEGNVSMRGSSNITVLINNKPSTIMASNIADALKQIPADEIKSIEVITSPSARYDAEGSAGIINIITKKNNIQGLTLNINAGVGTRGSNLGLNGNYRVGKMGFSLGGWGRANYNSTGRFESTNKTRMDLDSDWITNTQSSESRNNGLFGNYTLGWDYDINDKNYVIASVRLGGRGGKSYQDNFLTMREDQSGITSTLAETFSKDFSNNVDASLSYTRVFNTPQQELTFMGNFSRNNRTSDFVNTTLEMNGVAAGNSFKNLNDNFNQEITFQVDYQTPISSNQIFEIGAKTITRSVYSDYKSLFDQDGSGVFVPSTIQGGNNNLNYDQNVTGGYFSYAYTSSSNLSVKVGSRYEYTTINAYTKTESNIEIPSYGAFVPSLNLSKKLSNGKTLKLAYNRRIQRPSIRFLNPNLQFSNNRSVTQGNPVLDPEYTNNIELGYSTFIKGTTLNFSTFWRGTNNAIQDIRMIYNEEYNRLNNIESDTILTTYKNIGSQNAFGLNVFANAMIGRNLTLNGGFDVYYTVLDNNIPATDINGTNPFGQYSAHNEGWITSIRLNGSYKLPKGYSVQAFGMYRGQQVQLQGTQGGFGMYNLGLRKDFNNKKGSLGLAMENFLTREIIMKNEMVSPLIERHGLNAMRNMSFRLNFTYRIGKMSVDSKPKNRRSINNDDLKDGGMEGGGAGMEGGGMEGGPMGGGRGGNMPRMNGGAFAGTPVQTAPVDSTAVVNPVGKWNYSMESPQGTNAGHFEITSAEGGYAGTFFNQRANRDIPLTSVTLVGNELTFSYEMSFGGNSSAITVKGIITDNVFEGNMTMPFGTMPFKATKAE
jgi:outer membrane receptor protein involved in Fe transport